MPRLPQVFAFICGKAVGELKELCLIAVARMLSTAVCRMIPRLAADTRLARGHILNVHVILEDVDAETAGIFPFPSGGPNRRTRLVERFRQLAENFDSPPKGVRVLVASSKLCESGRNHEGAFPSLSLGISRMRFTALL